MARQLKKIALNVTAQEFQALEDYAERDGRTKTEVVRELLRTLPTYQPREDDDSQTKS